MKAEPLAPLGHTLRQARHVLLDRIPNQVEASLAIVSVLGSHSYGVVVVPECSAVLRVRVICRWARADVSGFLGVHHAAGTMVVDKTPH